MNNALLETPNTHRRNVSRNVRIKTTSLLVLLFSWFFESGCQGASDTIDLTDLEHKADSIRHKIDTGLIKPDYFRRIPHADIPTISPGIRPNFVEDYGCAVYFDFGDHIAADGYMVFEQESAHIIPSPPPIKIYKSRTVSPRTDRYIGEY